MLKVSWWQSFFLNLASSFLMTLPSQVPLTPVQAEAVRLVVQLIEDAIAGRLQAAAATRAAAARPPVKPAA
jgi:hypothetical protein